MPILKTEIRKEIERLLFSLEDVLQDSDKYAERLDKKMVNATEEELFRWEQLMKGREEVERAFNSISKVWDKMHDRDMIEQGRP